MIEADSNEAMHWVSEMSVIEDYLPILVASLCISGIYELLTPPHASKIKFLSKFSPKAVFIISVLRFLHSDTPPFNHESYNY